MVQLIYQTRDGDLFTDKETAKEHDDQLFSEWLEDVRTGNVTLNAFDVMTVLARDYEECEYFDTASNLFCGLLRKYWDLTETG